MFGKGSGNAVLQTEFFIANANAPLDLNEAYASGNLVSLSMTLTGEAFALNADGSKGERVHVFYQSPKIADFDGFVLNRGRVTVKRISSF